jgi:hypothetical protein
MALGITCTDYEWFGYPLTARIPTWQEMALASGSDPERNSLTFAKGLEGWVLSAKLDKHPHALWRQGAIQNANIHGQ